MNSVNKYLNIKISTGLIRIINSDFVCFVCKYLGYIYYFSGRIC